MKDIYVAAYDDDAAIVDFIQQGLEKDKRYRVKAIRAGTDAAGLDAVLVSIRDHFRESVREECPFLLLADSVVPGFNLSDVFKGLDPLIKVMVISGWLPEDILDLYQEEVEKGRLVSCIQKPFRLAALRSTLDAYFEGEVVPATVIWESKAEPFNTVQELSSEIERYLAELRKENILDEKLLASGRQIAKRALGFVGRFVQAPGQEGVNAHATRGLLAALEAALESAEVGKSPERIVQSLRRILSQFTEGEKSTQGLADLLKSLGSFGKLTVTANGNMPVLPTHVDMNEVETIVNNLLINANAHPEIKTVQFEGRETEDEILILVNDNGPALPEGFFTPKPTDTRGKRGNGARDMLAIAKNNGWVFKSGIAWGAKFALRIPKNKK